jgi:hypothetical protein
MSKKSRRRNRRLLKAAALLGGLALATRKRNRDDSIAANEAKEAGFDIPVKSKTIMDNMPKKTTKKKSVYQDPIMTGGKGVKQGFKTTSANVQKGKVDPPGFLGFKFSSPKIKMKTPDLKFGQVITKEGKKKTITPFKSAGLTFGGQESSTTPTQKAVNLANKQMSEGRLPPQLRAPGRTDITTRAGENRKAIKDFINKFNPFTDGIKKSGPSFSGLAEGDYAAKDGGRITKKGVKRGAAKRGFGRAYKKGRR